MAQWRPMALRRQPDQIEMAARIRAAMGYARVDRAELAAHLGTSPQTLDRKLGKRKEHSAITWDDVWATAELTQLPSAFFVADYDRLGELVPDDVPIPASQVLVDAASRAARRRRKPPGASEGTPDARDA